MKYVEAAGARVSAIGLGTWQFGSREWGYGEEYAGRTARDIVRHALDCGITLFDTAEIYAFGKSERILGEALGDARDTDAAFVATKLFPFAPLAPVVEWRAGESRRRLGVESIDLYQLHWPNPVVPIDWQTDGLKRCLDAGVIRNPGVSNYSLGQWQAAEKALGRPVVSNQVQFNLVQHGPLDRLVPYARETGRIVIAYSPLAQGLLSARYDASHPAPGGVRRMNPLFLPENLERASGLLDVLREIASDHDATPAQISLAWLLHQPNVVAIPGASSVEQVERNAAAAGIDMSAEEVERLTTAAEAFEPRAAGGSPVDFLRNLLRR